MMKTAAANVCRPNRSELYLYLVFATPPMTSGHMETEMSGTSISHLIAHSRSLVSAGLRGFCSNFATRSTTRLRSSGVEAPRPCARAAAGASTEMRSTTNASVRFVKAALLHTQVCTTLRAHYLRAQLVD